MRAELVCGCAVCACAAYRRGCIDTRLCRGLRERLLGGFLEEVGELLEVARALVRLDLAAVGDDLEGRVTTDLQCSELL